MKKLLLMLLSVLGLSFWINSAMAQGVQTASATPIQEVNLAKVRAKIRAKDNFYLFIGREDNHDAQLALKQLHETGQEASATILYLNLKGVNSRSYKSFSRAYNIRSHSYLAKFSQGQQVAIYHNQWSTAADDLVAFLSSSTP